MTTVLLALLLATAFPSTSQTSWMSPQSFRLVIGMTRADAVKSLAGSGWSVKEGRDGNELVVDYSDDKAMTLEFKRDRLRSVRFELFAMLPQIRVAFLEQKQFLLKTHGLPKKTNEKSVLIYDDRLPNIMVVLSADPKSGYGQKGIGFLAVRYYDPVVVKQ